jgi:hypothetical protein
MQSCGYSVPIAWQPTQFPIPSQSIAVDFQLHRDDISTTSSASFCILLDVLHPLKFLQMGMIMGIFNEL